MRLNPSGKQGDALFWRALVVVNFLELVELVELVELEDREFVVQIPLASALAARARGASGSLLTQTGRWEGLPGWLTGTPAPSEGRRFFDSGSASRRRKPSGLSATTTICQSRRRCAGWRGAPPGSVPHFPARVIRRLSN